MSDEDGSVQVTFNGGSSTMTHLRADLRRRGHVFHSRCDTEVLVHLWEEHGPAMVDHLVGMFAFAIWDDRGKSLFLARDRLGIKPLYFMEDGPLFAFASEIKALLPLLRRNEIDPTALSHYLTFVAVPAPRTLISGVSKLAPAHTLTIDKGGPRGPARYWDPIADRANFSGTSPEWESELRLRLERSIERRMMSDVPVGVFLSGGVDSSTNVALMSRLVSHPINTFSIGYHGEEQFNEFGWARRIASQFGTKHHEIKIDDADLWNFLPSLVHYQDEPIADPVCVPVYFVAKLAKDNGVTVVHVGEGADELFAGYDSFVQADRIARRYWASLRRMPGPVRAAVSALGGAVLARDPRREIHSEALRRAGQVDGHLWWGGAVAFYEQALDRISTERLRAHISGELPRDVVGRIYNDAESAGARDELDHLIYQDLRLRLPELLLMRVDKLTMANAVEARVPFLDHELVELAMAMPADEKIRGDVGKHVLKRAVGSLLPSDMIWRPKRGFSIPVAKWFRGPLGTRLEEQLRTSAIYELGYLDKEAILDVLELHRRGRGDRSFQLWNILNLSVWFDYWIAGREPISVAT